MSIVDSLDKLGLSEIESTVFVFLTRSGPALAPQIQSALGLNKVATYRALNSLNVSGIIRSSGNKRLQKYTAEPLRKFLDRYDKRIDEIHKAKEELEKWNNELDQNQDQLYKDQKIKVYEGIEGFRLWYDERLKGNVKIIREFGNNLYWQEFADSTAVGKRMANETMQKRLEKRISLKSIYLTDHNAPVVPPYARTRKDYLKETRVINMPSLPTGDISIFGTRFGFYTEDRGLKRGVIIDDSILVSLMLAIFENLWINSTPV